MERTAHLRNLMDRIEHYEQQIVEIKATRDLLRTRFRAEAARQRKASGLSLRKLGGVAGVSGQAIHQFENDGPWSNGIAHGVLLALS